jgi:hypothetical protein
VLNFVIFAGESICGEQISEQLINSASILASIEEGATRHEHSPLEISIRTLICGGILPNHQNTVHCSIFLYSIPLSTE